MKKNKHPQTLDAPRPSLHASDPHPACGLEPILVPSWTELPWLVHGFSTRTGGSTTVYRPDAPQTLSSTPRGDLNLGFTAHDDRATVLANRERLIAHLLGASRSGTLPPLVTIRQTHSAIVHRVTHAPSPPGLEGDGLLTNEPGLLLGILTADCVPVLVVDPRRRAVAAFHAGWRGTVQRIVKHGVARMYDEFGSRPEDLWAAIGPAIGPCCYNVGEELRQKFISEFTYAGELFSKPALGPSPPAGSKDALRLDLAAANSRQLLDAGLNTLNITTIAACTSCQTHRFFSHRAEQGATGRMMAVVGVRSESSS